MFGWVVLAAWAVSFVLSALLPKYDPGGVQAIALIVAGYLFGAPVARGLLDRRTPREPEEERPK